MLLRDDILKLETRRELYQLILKNPGLHLREIKRRMNISLGSLQYHLKYLEKYDFINSKNDQKYIRYYAKEKIDRRDKEILNLLRQDIPLKIILLLLVPGPGKIYKDKETYKKSLKNPEVWNYTYSKKELIGLTKYWRKSDCFHIKKHYTTVGFHLQKLLDVDLIEKVNVGKEIKYKLKDEDLVVAFLIKYKDALSKDSIDTSLIWRRNTYVMAAEKLLEIGYDIFPHPYHA